MPHGYAGSVEQDGSGSVTGSIAYEAFGQPVATSGSSASPYTFAATSGYRNDGDAGLTHVGARYYDAQVGRFITRDTELDQHPYLYCDHDPVNAVDPSGHLSVQYAKDALKYFAPVKSPACWFGAYGGVESFQSLYDWLEADPHGSYRGFRGAGTGFMGAGAGAALVTGGTAILGGTTLGAGALIGGATLVTGGVALIGIGVVVGTIGLGRGLHLW